MRDIVIGGVYRHFKQHNVKVLAEAYDSETLETMVVYIHLDEGSIWVRPKDMFLGQISLNGKTINRFEEIPETIPKPSH
jgi:hypothetical protein